MTESLLKLERALEADGPALLELAARIENFLPEDVDCVRELWQDFLHPAAQEDPYHFLVARRENRLLGFACFGHRPLTTGTYDLYWLAVDPSARQHGIGRSLLKEVEDQARSVGAYLLIVETSGLEEFSATRAFYRSCGYQLAASIPDFYRPGDALILFTRRLDPAA
jgi:ribosomal protein S18 acetylase RimI-like enzyme